MTTPPTMLERAYQLARTGEFRSTPAIRAQLKREGYAQTHVHIAGRALIQSLNRACAEAQAQSQPPVEVEPT
jgi:hypothetical protein